MPSSKNLYMYKTGKSKGLFCFSRDPKGSGLPESFSPWEAIGVLRPDQKPPHGLKRQAIETGIDTNGFQLWRDRRKPAANAKR
ncbi:MAG: hypothetical protein IT541_14680 [Hyphomicrobiales bacterium]|nr:hypothetical protein [Hyphomicrobiales bacterium]